MHKASVVYTQHTNETSSSEGEYAYAVDNESNSKHTIYFVSINQSKLNFWLIREQLSM